MSVRDIIPVSLNDFIRSITIFQEKSPAFLKFIILSHMRKKLYSRGKIGPAPKVVNADS